MSLSDTEFYFTMAGDVSTAPANCLYPMSAPDESELETTICDRGDNVDIPTTASHTTQESASPPPAEETPLEATSLVATASHTIHETTPPSPAKDTPPEATSLVATASHTTQETASPPPAKETPPEATSLVATASHTTQETASPPPAEETPLEACPPASQPQAPESSLGLISHTAEDAGPVAAIEV
jgi:hypothetical protein